MNYLKSNPVGVDVKIQALQEELFKLKDIWGSAPNEFQLDGYGRTYFTGEDGKSILEAHVQGNDYTGNLLTVDKNKFFFFKIKKPIPEGSFQYKQVFDVLFIINSKEAKPDIPHLADAEIFADVERVLRSNTGLPLEVLDFDDNIQTIFKNYDFRYIDDIDFTIFDGMQPTIIFKFGISIVYSMLDEYSNC